MPGCDHEQHLHAHHIEHWIDGGETTAQNVILLCSRCHRLAHEGGFSVIRGDDGQLHFFAPDRRELSQSPPTLHSSGGEQALRKQAATLGLQFGPKTMPLWQGERMDLNWAGDLFG